MSYKRTMYPRSRKLIYTDMGIKSTIPPEISLPPKKVLVGHGLQGRNEIHTNVYVQPRMVDGKKYHRVFAQCPSCYTMHPLGRLHQHYLSVTCLAYSLDKASS